MRRQRYKKIIKKVPTLQQGLWIFEKFGDYLLTNFFVTVFSPFRRMK